MDESHPLVVEAERVSSARKYKIAFILSLTLAIGLLVALISITALFFKNSSSQNNIVTRKPKNLIFFIGGKLHIFQWKLN
jgi:hypothetical protein